MNTASPDGWVVWDDHGLPVEIKVFAAGVNPASDGLRATYDPQRAQAIIDSCHTADKMVAINIDHLHNYSTSPVQAHEAAGWGKLEARTDGIWLVSIEWRASYADKVKDRAWRYTSAEFRVDEEERIVEVSGLALTNTPATFDAHPIVRNNVTFRRSITAATMPLVRPGGELGANSLVKPMANNVNEAGATVAEPDASEKPVAAANVRAEDPKDEKPADGDSDKTAPLDLEKVDPQEVLKSPNALQLIEQLLDMCRDSKRAMDEMSAERAKRDDGDDGDDDDKAEAYDEERKELLTSLWSESRISSKQRREMRSMSLRKIKEFASAARRNDAKVKPGKDAIVEKPHPAPADAGKEMLRKLGYDPDASNTVSEQLAKAKQLHDRATKWAI